MASATIRFGLRWWVLPYLHLCVLAAWIAVRFVGATPAALDRMRDTEAAFVARHGVWLGHG